MISNMELKIEFRKYSRFKVMVYYIFTNPSLDKLIPSPTIPRVSPRIRAQP